MDNTLDFIDEMIQKPKKNSWGKRFDFKEQMAVGDRGESDFISFYPQLKPQKSTKELAFDFILSNGKTVELKTDDYFMDETPNFFMETISDIASGKVGGPSRAFKDGVDFFVYYYLKDKVFYWFEVPKLHEHLLELIKSKKFKIKSIPNKGWTAQGYAIPRSSFESIILQKDCAA